GRFGGGSYTGTNASNLSYLNGSGAANTFFDATGSPINGNSNGGVNPMLRSYNRAADLTLVTIDPRPASGSPLLNSSLQTGAPSAASFRGAFGSDNWAAGWTQLSIAGVLQGEAPSTGGSAPFADTDNDGISDTLEATAALTSLGFSVGVNDVSPANRFQNVFTSSSILDVRAAGQVTVQAGASNVSLTLPVQKSDTLGGWTSAGNMTLTMPKTSGKEFYRITIPD
ncbi:MAG: hypothetical protein EAZ82_13390, partial [Verrucomicrobia bacterium]